jgi:hypothetical protein
MAPACRFFYFHFHFSFYFENKSLHGRQGSVDGIRMWSLGFYGQCSIGNHLHSIETRLILQTMGNSDSHTTRKKKKKKL